MKPKFETPPLLVKLSDSWIARPVFDPGAGVSVAETGPAVSEAPVAPKMIVPLTHTETPPVHPELPNFIEKSWTPIVRPVTDSGPSVTVLLSVRLAAPNTKPFS